MIYILNAIIFPIIVLLTEVCYCDYQVQLPPSIVVHPLLNKIYRVDDEVTLECIAGGVPAPRYEWRKNGAVLDPLPNVIFIGNGSIHLTPLTTLDEGYYQCYAFNDYGTAVSSMALLRRAVITPNPPMDVKDYTLVEGRPLLLRCQQTKSYPKPHYSWSVFSEYVPEKVISQDARIQIDNSGNLHFAHLNLIDSYNGSTYKCRIKNLWLGIEYGGSYARLNISASDESDYHFGPVLGFSSPPEVIGLLGTAVTLRCFFYGRPAPEITWSRVDGVELWEDGRFVLRSYNTELVINDVELADEAVYLCSAKNNDVTVVRSIVLKVEAAPVFESAESQPFNVNGTEGTWLSLFCQTSARPPAVVTWFRNGIATNNGGWPARYTLSEDRQVLTISELCRECQDGSSDLQVIQCNASNQHGFVFTAGYVNVLMKTVAEAKPATMLIDIRKRAIAKFTCSAISDPSTPVVISWHRVGDLQSFAILDTGDSGVFVDGNHSLIFRARPGSMNWLEYLGVYRCLAENGYSSDSSDVFLNAIELPMTTVEQYLTASLSVLTTEVHVGEVAAAGTQLYWIAILVIVVVAIIVIVVLVRYCYCLRGDSYNVDGKELQDNKDPVKELREMQLQEYCRPDWSTPLGNSRASLVSTVSQGDEPNEVADDDDAMFHETGSFIGVYS